MSPFPPSMPSAFAGALVLALSALSTVPASASPLLQGGYAASSTAYQWEELAISKGVPVAGATRVLGNNDDSATGTINLGFSFSFFNQSFNQAYITSNGLLTFGGTTTNNNNTSDSGLGDVLSFSTMPFVAVAWDDWTTTFSGTDGVYYKLGGSAGQRTFTVEWRDTKKYDTASNSNSSPVSFEAVLYEGSNAIELRYRDMNTGGSAVNPDASFGATAVVGIRDVDAFANGRFLQWSKNQAVLADGTAILITPMAGSVPEPQSAALALAGLAALGTMARRRSRVRG